MKKWISWTLIITIIGTFLTFGEGINLVRSFYNDYILIKHHNQVELFNETSAIIDHRFEDGKLYLKYKTCNPPTETPDYYYEVWIDGKPVFHSQSVAPHFSINSWFKPLYCTEGWWGNKGFDGAEVGDEVSIVWHWMLDDGSYDETIMRYLIK